MKQEKHEAAAAAMVEGELAMSNLAELHARLRPCFARSEPFAQVGQYVTGLMSDLPRKNGWTLTEHAGDQRPDGMQRLLNHAVWDEQEAMATIRPFVVEHLDHEESLQVATLDESGQQKQGNATAGAQRQYMGCAGRVENGVNTARMPPRPGTPWSGPVCICLPVSSTTRTGERNWASMPRWSSKRSRSWPRICWPPWSPTAPCRRGGSKGSRRYAWAWMATTSDRHFLLIRKHLETAELAYHYCYIPPDRPVTLTSLVQVACLRWPVEEDFESGKDHFGLDQSQVRLHTALTRHIVLTMAALAVCAVTAMQAKTRAAAPELPTRADQSPPSDPGLIPLTVPEIKRLFVLARNWLHGRAHHLHWHWWRRHQARARWFYHRTRLQRAEQQP